MHSLVRGPAIAAVVWLINGGAIAGDVCDWSYSKDHQKAEKNACKFGLSMGRQSSSQIGFVQGVGTDENPGQLKIVWTRPGPGNTGREVMWFPTAEDGSHLAELLESVTTTLPLDRPFILDYDDGKLSDVKLLGDGNVWTSSPDALKLLNSDSFKDEWWASDSKLQIAE